MSTDDYTYGERAGEDAFAQLITRSKYGLAGVAFVIGIIMIAVGGAMSMIAVTSIGSAIVVFAIVAAIYIYVRNMDKKDAPLALKGE